VAEAAVVARRIATPPPPHGGRLQLECSMSHCCRIGIGGGNAHPSDDRKDDDESSRRGGTHHHRGDCDDAVGYRHCHISQDHRDQDYDDEDDNAGHTTCPGQRDRGSAPLLPPLLPLLSVGDTVPLICADP